MIKIPCTIAACSLAMVGTSAFAQETVPVDEWAFTSNYAVNTATITGEDTNSPVIVNAAQSIGWAGKFPAMRLSEPDDSVLLSFDLTVDQSFGSGNTRFALTSSGSASGTRQGIPPIWTGSDFAGWRGYTFALAGGGNAPGANGGAAGTGTLVARNSGNWISTNGDDYSLLTDSPYLGPSTDADAGDYHGEIELYRVDASTIEVTITVNNADSSYLYTLASVLDTGAVASAITQVDTFAWGSTASTAATYTWSNVTVTGVPVGGEETWAGFTVIADGEGAGWVDTGADVLGWVYPYEGDDYIWSARVGAYLYVDAANRAEIEAGNGFWTYVFRVAE